jgi:hypothetical protein
MLVLSILCSPISSAQASLQRLSVDFLHILTHFPSYLAFKILKNTFLELENDYFSFLLLNLQSRNWRWNLHKNMLFHEKISANSLLYKHINLHLSAICSIIRRSITGYCVFLGDSLVSRKCKEQPTMSRLSSEVKYRALASTVCETQWLTFLLRDLHVNFVSPALLFWDNESAQHIAHNVVFYERTKHIKIDCHVVCERLQKGLMHLLLINTQRPVSWHIHQGFGIEGFSVFAFQAGSIQ